ncbi:transposase [Endozoicomonas euniceicola]|uniref:transposase n=1 Tax=Endozoicomonas euniceicola TaxID=1234143 RepID=UPI00384F27E2
MRFHDLLDNAKCYEQLRQLRWPAGVYCPHCGSQNVIDGESIRLSLISSATSVRDASVTSMRRGKASMSGLLELLLS